MELRKVLTRLTCPALLGPDEVLRGVEFIEREIPSADLNYTLIPPGRPTHLTDRAELIRSGFKSPEAQGIWLNNSVESNIFELSIHYFAHSLPDDYWQVNFEQPPDALAANGMLPFLLGLGDLLAAYDGNTSSDRAATANLQLNRGMGPNFTPPHGLPPLYPPETYVSMRVPFCIEWCNYWSRETAATMGFSESEHAQLFHRWQRGASGSLVFQLTPEPIDLDRPEDIRALQIVYSAFPGIGGRDPKFRIPDEAPSQEGA